MKPELRDCIKDLDDLEISEHEKEMLMMEIWKVVQTFAQIGFGVEATQYAILSNQMNPRKNRKDSLRFRHTPK